MVSTEDIARILEAYPRDRRHALAVMQDMQREFNYIPKEGIEALSKHLDTSKAHLYSMATFYKALSLVPKGRHIIKICNGTACHIRGSMNLKTGLQRELGIEPGQTTEDGEFSVELVNCVGSCALAPVMLVDGTYYNKLKLDDVSHIIGEYKDADAKDGASGEDTGADGSDGAVAGIAGADGAGGVATSTVDVNTTAKAGDGHE